MHSLICQMFHRTFGLKYFFLPSKHPSNHFYVRHKTFRHEVRPKPGKKGLNHFHAQAHNILPLYVSGDATFDTHHLE